MLSFFRSKSSDATVNKIISDTENLSIEKAEIAIETTVTPITAMNSTTINTKSPNECTDSNALLKSLGYQNETELRETIYGKMNFSLNHSTKNIRFSSVFHSVDILRTIRDPEKPSTLEDLKVVYEDGIFVQLPTSDSVQVVSLLIFHFGAEFFIH